MSAKILSQSSYAATYPLAAVERFLRDREGVWEQIGHEYRLDLLIREMLVSSAISLAGYGLVMGISSSLLQALSSAIKLPLLFLLTLAVCLPTLYLHNLLFGGRLSVRQAIALVLSATMVTSVLTVAFAPITLFLITAQSYGFFLLLNVAILALTGAAGLQFLVGAVRHLNRSQATATLDTAPEAPHAALQKDRLVHMRLLQLWLLLYAFVGTQLGWTLRPFFGAPGADFQLFRQLESNFYERMLQLIVYLFFA
jgi:hypothetical protein